MVARGWPLLAARPYSPDSLGASGTKRLLMQGEGPVLCSTLPGLRLRCRLSACKLPAPRLMKRSAFQNGHDPVRPTAQLDLTMELPRSG
jgi:hypothetical protein